MIPAEQTRPETSAAEHPYGITVELYAGIKAAVAEGFEIERVLRAEGLDPAIWPKADAAWKVRLTRHPGALFSLYKEKLWEAEDCLSRAVSPLDSDLEAWVSFLKAYSSHSSPYDLLRGLGLGLNDVSRLGRRWSRRMVQERSFEKRAAELGKGKPKALPRVTTEPPQLKPFPWSKRQATAPKNMLPAAALSAAENRRESELSLDQYAALRAKLDIEPRERERTLERHGLDARGFEVIDRFFQARLQASPESLRDYRALHAYYSKISRALAEAHEGKDAAPAKLVVFPAASELMHIAIAKPVPDGAASRSPSARVEELTNTSLLPDMPLGPALPFVPGVSHAIESSSEKASGPPSEDLGATVQALDVPSTLALPFLKKAAPEPSITDAPTEKAAHPPFENLAETVLALDVPSTLALPFLKKAAPEPSITDAPTEKAARPPSEDLGETVQALDVPSTLALPFMKKASSEVWDTKASAKKSARPPSEDLGETVQALDVPSALALPFVTNDSSEPSAVKASTVKMARSPSQDLSGTAPALEMPIGPSIPFGEDAGRASSAARSLSGAEPLRFGRAHPITTSAEAPGTSLPPKARDESDLPFTTDELSTSQAMQRLGESLPSLDMQGELLAAVRAVLSSSPHRATSSPAIAPRITSALPAPSKPPAWLPEPSLTLEQHASLCVELATNPERAPEIFARYRLTPDTKAQLDEHYRKLVSASPEARLAWNQAYKTYHEWLSSSRISSR
jgi:hypothetical protein